MKKALVIGAVVLVIAGGAGFAAMRFLNKASEDVAIDLVPEDAYIYGNLYIQPSGDQKRALDELLGNFPKIESTDQAINRLTELLDEELEQVGLSYDEDVEPWLGNQISFFLSGDEVDPPDGAGLLETTDPDAAADAFEKLRASEGGEETEQKTYEGVDYELEAGDGETPVAFGFVENFLVVGTENGFKAVVDGSADDSSLADSEGYQVAFEGLDDQNILSVYLDQSRVFELLEESGELQGEDAAIFNAFPGLSDAGPSGFVLSARDDGIAFQSSTAVPEDGGLGPLGGVYGGTELIGELPADSWVALGVPNIGEVIQGLFDTVAEMPGAGGEVDEVSAQFERETGLNLEEDVLAWMGDAALFVQGTNFQEMGGGLIVESNDPEQTRETLDEIRQRIETEQVPTTDESRGDYEGFSIQAGLPAPLYALAADRLVITYGDSATDGAVEPEATLGEAPIFQAAEDALGDDYDPSFFVDMDAVMEVVDFARGFSGQTDDAYEEDVKPWLEPLSFVIAGSRQDDDRAFQTLFVGVGAEESS